MWNENDRKILSSWGENCHCVHQKIPQEVTWDRTQAGEGQPELWHSPSSCPNLYEVMEYLMPFVIKNIFSRIWNIRRRQNKLCLPTCNVRQGCTEVHDDRLYLYVPRMNIKQTCPFQKAGFYPELGNLFAQDTHIPWDIPWQLHCSG
jgi:hypothetical protein